MKSTSPKSGAATISWRKWRIRWHAAAGMRAWLDTVRLDALSSIRALRRDLRFTSRVAFTVGLGLSCTFVAFSVFNTLILKALPYPDPDRLISIARLSRTSGTFASGISGWDLKEIRERTRLFDGIGGYKRGQGVGLSNNGEFASFSDTVVSGEFFRAIGVKPMLGRWIDPEDNQPGKGDVVVLSYELWRGEFASSGDVIGRVLRLDNRPYTIVGIMPPQFNFPSAGTELWLPERLTTDALANRNVRDKFVVGRLKRGASLGKARAEFTGLSSEMSRQSEEAGDAAFALEPLEDQIVGPIRGILASFLAATVLILLVSSANVANLLLARNATRQRETAVRLALGAPPLRLLQQFLVESLFLGSLGGCIGAAVTLGTILAIRKIGPASTPRLSQVHGDLRVLAFAVCVTLMASILFGVIPAWQSLDVDVNSSLKEGCFSSRTRFAALRGRRLQDLLTAAQVALAITLAVASALTARSLSVLTNVALGFEPHDLSAVQLWTRLAPGASVAFYAQVLRDVSALPGVKAAALVSLFPFRGESFGISFAAETRARGWVMVPRAEFQVVSPGYFATMSIPLKEGRQFTEWDVTTSPCAVIINDAMSEGLWAGGDPIGNQINLNGMDRSDPYYCSVIGVAGNSRDINLETPPEPEIYFSSYQRPQRLYCLLLRTTESAPSLTKGIMESVRATDQAQQLGRVEKFDDMVRNSTADPRFRAIAVGFFAGLTLLLATTGVYGVTAYSVSQRTHEIGIRLALGATRPMILQLILRRTLGLVIIGTGLGLCGAFIAGRVLENVLYQVRPIDNFSFTAALSLVLSASFLASYLPARRAAKLEPKILLRYE